MKDESIAKQMKAGGYFLAIAVTQVDAWVDAIFHPEIPYFDMEHLVVGGVLGLLAATFTFVVSRSMSRRAAERKQAEEALRESGRKFSAFMDGAFDYFHIVDKDLNLIYANPSMTKMLGMGDLTGKNLSEIFAEPLPQEQIDSIVATLIKEGSIEFEHQWKTRNGRLLDGEVHLFAVYGHKGEYNGINAIFHDVTESRNAGKVLARKISEQEALLRIGRSVQEMMRPVDLEQTICVCYEEFREVGLKSPVLAIYRLVDEKAKRFEVHRILPSGEYQKNVYSDSLVYQEWKSGQTVYRRDLEEDLEGESPGSFTRSKDVYGVPIRCSVDVPLATGLLAVLGTPANAFSDVDVQFVEQASEILSVGVARADDIEEIEISRKALQESEEKYRELVESTDDLVTQVDSRGNLLYVNYRAQDVFGLSPEDCIGLSAFPFIHPDDRSRTESWFAECVRNRLLSGTIENRQISRSGEIREMLWTSNFHYDSDGDVMRVNGIGRDITERKRMEQELEAQRLKAVQADRLHALGEMAAGVAHELNQPLAVISSTAEGICLRHQAGIEVSPEQVNLQMGDVLKLVDRMSEIINHMRVFARDTSEEDPLPLLIPEVIQNTLKFVQAQLKAHGIAVHMDIAEDLPECRGWANEIEQVLLNLISNARDVMDERGEKMKTGVLPSDPGWEPVLGVQARLDPDGRFLRIEISDTGGGISEDALPRIFDPFFTTKEVGQGTGLGLSIAQGFVEKHRGRLEVDNRPGDGVTFSVVLPVGDK